MSRTKIALVLAGLMLFVFGIFSPNAYAADKTLTVKIIVAEDFWNSKITFPNGNKAQVSGIGVVLLDKGLPQVFKTLTPGQNELTFTHTGAEGATYQIKIPFLAGPNASVYQNVEKVENNGQTLTYKFGVDIPTRPLIIERVEK
ncbi:hypothetical protein SRRS_47310 [Sporomusa rhizae]|uniref:hypothetical protein n=1 Tax=Sporomusa rhizae TaxID=357999 RepID=UPI003529F113